MPRVRRYWIRVLSFFRNNFVPTNRDLITPKPSERGLVGRIRYLENSVDTLRENMISQEHRPFYAAYTFLEALKLKKGDKRRTAAFRTFLRVVFFSPRNIVAAGISITAVVGLFFAWQANQLLEIQNELISTQNTYNRKNLEVVQKQYESALQQIEDQRNRDREIKESQMLNVLYGGTDSDLVFKRTLSALMNMNKNKPILDLTELPIICAIRHSEFSNVDLSTSTFQKVVSKTSFNNCRMAGTIFAGTADDVTISGSNGFFSIKLEKQCEKLNISRATGSIDAERGLDYSYFSGCELKLNICRLNLAQVHNSWISISPLEMQKCSFNESLVEIQGDLLSLDNCNFNKCFIHLPEKGTTIRSGHFSDCTIFGEFTKEISENLTMHNCRIISQYDLDQISNELARLKLPYFIFLADLDRKFAR